MLRKESQPHDNHPLVSVTLIDMFFKFKKYRLTQNKIKAGIELWNYTDEERKKLMSLVHEKQMFMKPFCAPCLI